MGARLAAVRGRLLAVWGAGVLGNGLFLLGAVEDEVGEGDGRLWVGALLVQVLCKSVDSLGGLTLPGPAGGFQKRHGTRRTEIRGREIGT